MSWDTTVPATSSFTTCFMTGSSAIRPVSQRFLASPTTAVSALTIDIQLATGAATKVLLEAVPSENEPRFSQAAVAFLIVLFFFAILGPPILPHSVRWCRRRQVLDHFPWFRRASRPQGSIYPLDANNSSTAEMISPRPQHRPPRSQRWMPRARMGVHSAGDDFSMSITDLESQDVEGRTRTTPSSHSRASQPSHLGTNREQRSVVEPGIVEFPASVYHYPNPAFDCAQGLPTQIGFENGLHPREQATASARASGFLSGSLPGIPLEAVHMPDLARRERVRLHRSCHVYMNSFGGEITTSSVSRNRDDSSSTDPENISTPRNFSCEDDTQPWNACTSLRSGVSGFDIFER